MKLLKIALSLAALITCSSMFASTDVAFQEVLDRNANPYIAKGDHDNRIFWSAMLKGIAGMRTSIPDYNFTTNKDLHKRTASDITLPRANIVMDAVVNDWTMAHIALSFHRFSLNNQNLNLNVTDETSGLTHYNRSGIFSAFDGLSYRPYQFVDEAFVTIGNLHRHPAYMRMGLGRVPFGLYERNQILVNYTTLYTEIQTMYAQFGFADASGIFGSAYVFRGLAKSGDLAGNGFEWTNDGKVNINNGGASIGFCKHEGNMGFKAVVDWVYNYYGAVNLFRAVTPNATRTGSKVTYSEVMGLHVGVKGHYNQFDFRANYVTALKKFSDKDVMFKGQRPGAFSAEVGMHFKMGHKPSRIALGYQKVLDSKKAAIAVASGGTAMLKGIVHEHRMTADITAEVHKNVTAGIHYAHEIPHAKTIAPTSKAKVVHTLMMSLTTKVA